MKRYALTLRSDPLRTDPHRIGPLRGSPRRRTPPRNDAGGFTLLEILIAMSIFTVLGTMMVWFMSTSLDIFSRGMKESDLMDRADTILPRVRADLNSLIIPDNFDPPLTPPSADALDGRTPPPPPPPVLVRLRSGFIKLQRTGDPAFKDYPCPYFAFVVADASEWSDRLKRRAGEIPTKDAGLKPLSPETLAAGNRDSHYLPTGGLTEICWIAVPQDVMNPPGKGMPRYPALLSLYRGFRTPVGHPEKSLLLPENLDSPEKIKTACRLVAEGLVHFGAIWRRAFAKDWGYEEGIGLGETAGYVGPRWDSTRALDKEWSLFRSRTSLGDPSDDIFPAFVRLEATLAPPSSQFGHGPGEMMLTRTLSTDTTDVEISDPDVVMALNLGKERWLKIDAEWMQYDRADVDYEKRTVRVRRGMRGTTKTSHASGAWVYVGMPNDLQMRLPVFRDRALQVERGER